MILDHLVNLCVSSQVSISKQLERISRLFLWIASFMYICIFRLQTRRLFQILKFVQVQLRSTVYDLCDVTWISAGVAFSSWLVYICTSNRIP